MEGDAPDDGNVANMAWLPTTPDDLPDLDCDHEEYELDILTGRATCTVCDHRWFMSEAELKHDQELRMAPYPGQDEQ